MQNIQTLSSQKRTCVINSILAYKENRVKFNFRVNISDVFMRRLFAYNAVRSHTYTL